MMRMNSKQVHRNGFGLIEIMVGLGILSVAAVVVGMVILNGAKAHRQNTNVSLITQSISTFRSQADPCLSLLRAIFNSGLPYAVDFTYSKVTPALSEAHAQSISSSSTGIPILASSGIPLTFHPLELRIHYTGSSDFSLEYKKASTAVGSFGGISHNLNTFGDPLRLLGNLRFGTTLFTNGSCGSKDTTALSLPPPSTTTGGTTSTSGGTATTSGGTTSTSGGTSTTSGGTTSTSGGTSTTSGGTTSTSGGTATTSGGTTSTGSTGGPMFVCPGNLNDIKTGCDSYCTSRGGSVEAFDAIQCSWTEGVLPLPCVEDPYASYMGCDMTANPNPASPKSCDSFECRCAGFSGPSARKELSCFAPNLPGAGTCSRKNKTFAESISFCSNYCNDTVNGRNYPNFEMKVSCGTNGAPTGCNSTLNNYFYSYDLCGPLATRVSDIADCEIEPECNCGPNAGISNPKTCSVVP